MTVGDRLRAVPRPWWVIGICGLGVVFAFVLVSWTGSSGSVASDDGATPTLPTTSLAVSTTATSLPATLAPTSPSPSSTVIATSTDVTTTTIDLSEQYGLEVEEDDPAVVARPIPGEPTDSTPPSTLAPPPWAASTRTTPGGYVGTNVGCVTELSAPTLDKFFAPRIGPRWNSA